MWEELFRLEALGDISRVQVQPKVVLPKPYFNIKSKWEQEGGPFAYLVYVAASLLTLSMYDECYLRLNPATYTK